MRRKTPANAGTKNLVVAVRESVEAMTWLTASDQALVEQAVAYADQTERVVSDANAIRRSMMSVLEDPAATHEERIRASERIDAANAAVVKATGWLGPHLVGALKALGGGPVERKALAEGGAVGGRLAHLRSARQGAASSVDGAAS